MTDVNILKFPECPEFLDKSLTSPAKEIGTTLGNIFYAVFSPINYNVEKLRIKHAENLKKYQWDLEHELNKIPEEHLIEPDLSIVGPALEASKFYIQEEDIRKMFAKLIASSMDSTSSANVHHAFVEIIKQINPTDASNLKFISQTDILPIVEYQLKLPDNSTRLLQTNVFIANPTHQDIIIQSASVSNLTRLGLTSVEYDRWISDESIYASFKQHYSYIDHEVSLAKYDLRNDEKLDIRKGIIQLTPFGRNFSSICC